MDKLNRWLTQLTNLGVLVGLVVLVYEVNQNTQALQNETDVAIYSMAAVSSQLYFGSEELRRLVMDSRTKPWSEFSEADQMMLAFYWRNEVGSGLIGLELSAALRYGIAAGALLWFWFATRGAESWEAAALGFSLIPLLTSPPGYYFHFVVFAVPLCERRPSIAVWLLAACGAWQINGFLSRDLGEQFSIVSIIAVVLSCAVLATMRRAAKPV